MKYGIVVNPAAGKISKDKKYHLMQDAARIIGDDCIVDGLDTQSPEEYRACAKRLSEKTDVIIVAGGDGTFFDVLNAVDHRVILAYIPLGSGNALRYSLKLPRSITAVAQRIKNGTEHEHDVLLYNNAAKTLFASVGIDSNILHRREHIMRYGISGFSAYALATGEAVMGRYKRKTMRITVDGNMFACEDVISIIITKIPYYGYGLKMVPRAVPDDNLLHFLCINAHTVGVWWALLTSVLSKNDTGIYCSGRHFSIESDEPVGFQMNGVLQKEDTHFNFSVLPHHIRIRY